MNLRVIIEETQAIKITNTYKDLVDIEKPLSGKQKRRLRRKRNAKRKQV